MQLSTVGNAFIDTSSPPPHRHFKGALSGLMIDVTGVGVTGGASRRASLSPVLPLSPAFAAAAEMQREQLARMPSLMDHDDVDAMGVDASTHADDNAVLLHNNNNGNSNATTAVLPGDAPDPIHDDSFSFARLDSQLKRAEEFIASTSEKLVGQSEDVLDSLRKKYPHVVHQASIERQRIEQQQNQRHSAALMENTVDTVLIGMNGDGRKHMDEESTMELKAQVIFNRALAQQRQEEQARHQPFDTIHPHHSTTAVAAAAAATSTAVTTGSKTDESGYMQSAVLRSKQSLQDAIAAALGKQVIPSNAVSAATTTPAVHSATTLAAATHRMMTAPRTMPTPSLPSTVPPFSPVNTSTYSTCMPPFIRDQIPLDSLNKTAAAMHAVATRRCTDGEPAYFTMDDVESVGELPAGKGKVFINALAKLEMIQLKVVLGPGTVFFFVPPKCMD